MLKIILACLIGVFPMTALSQQTTETDTIRFGIIGTDTSHVTGFAKLLNHPEAEGHVPGGRITHAFKGGSTDVEASRDRVEKFAAELQSDHGVELVDSIPELVEKVDAVLLESVDGRPHLEQVNPVFDANKPVFIDKPLAGSLKDAIEIARLAKESGTPCFSASSLRFFSGVTELADNEKIGDITGVSAYSPATYEEHHPDLYWYGIHGVEILYTLMGPGCETVSRTYTDDYDLVTGTWSDGRIGTFRGLRKGKATYGALVFGTKGIQHTAPVSGSLYGPLMKEIVEFVKTGKAPVPMETTVEMMAFMEAADESKRQGGKPVRLDDVIDKAQQ